MKYLPSTSCCLIPVNECQGYCMRQNMMMELNRKWENQAWS